jgi:ADP-heptose:LPS heptosyltransferase
MSKNEIVSDAREYAIQKNYYHIEVKGYHYEIEITHWNKNIDKIHFEVDHERSVDLDCKDIVAIMEVISRFGYKLLEEEKKEDC